MEIETETIQAEAMFRRATALPEGSYKEAQVIFNQILGKGWLVVVVAAVARRCFVVYSL